MAKWAIYEEYQQKQYKKYTKNVVCIEIFGIGLHHNYIHQLSIIFLKRLPLTLSRISMRCLCFYNVYEKKIFKNYLWYALLKVKNRRTKFLRNNFSTIDKSIEIIAPMHKKRTPGSSMQIANRINSQWVFFVLTHSHLFIALCCANGKGAKAKKKGLHLLLFVTQLTQIHDF